MIDLEPVLQEVINQLPNIVIDENNSCCIRFDVGIDTWKLFVNYNSETGECSIQVKKRDN
jgi:hypothetical protein